MTLVTDLYLRSFYNEAKSDYEHAPLSFWAYLFKVHFHERWFLYDREKPANEQLDPLRRVDAQLRYIESNMQAIRVLFFHEAKKSNVADSKMTDVEGQAFEACATYCRGKEFTHVYAFTTIGTEARAWKYWHVTGSFQCLTDSKGSGDRSAYIEVDSPEASKLGEAIQHMKDYPPSSYAASIAHATTASNPAQPVPKNPVPESASTSMPSQSSSTNQWKWSEQHSRYYRWDSQGKCEWGPVT